MKAPPLTRYGPPSLSRVNTPSYKHSNLDINEPGEIRLLKLLPGRGATPITCEIIHANIADSAHFPVYEALSYCWGTSPPSCYIQIDGLKYHVRENLCWALYYLRLSAGACPRMLWIDALCINQQSNSERNHQVAQMGNIYRSATKVLAWLGSPTLESLYAFDILRSSQPLSFQHLNTDLDPDSPELTSFGALVHLCSREYWGRLWIIQELLLAQDVVLLCGPESCCWDRFCSAMTSIKVMHASPAYRLIQMRENHEERSLFMLMRTFQNQLCENPRDKIYGLVGVASDVQNGEVSIDYSRTCHQVWHQLLSVYISRLQADGDTLVSFATLAWRVLKFVVDDPSDWYHLTEKLFPIRAGILGEVQELGTPIRFQKSLDPDEWKVGTWLDNYRLETFSGHQSTASNLPWGSEYSRIYSVRQKFSYGFWVSAWRFSSTGSYAESSTKTPSRQEEVLPKMHSKLWAWTPASKSMPRLFRTKSGYWGLAPPGCEVGDILCSLEPRYSPPKYQSIISAIFIQRGIDGTLRLNGKGMCERELASQGLEETSEGDIKLHLDSYTVYEIVTNQ